MASTIKCDTILLPDGSTPTAADLGIDVSGSVVQVKRHEWTDNVYYNNDNTYVTATGSTFSFTPKYASSLLLIQASVSLNIYQSNNYAGANMKIVHDGTVISYQWTAHENYIYVLQATPIDYYTRLVKDAVVNASSTSARDISVQIAPYAASEVQINQGNNFSSTITVYEIAQ